MKTLTAFIAIAFSLLTTHVIAQAGFSINGEAINALTITGDNDAALKFETSNNGLYIKWQTTNENNTSHFELQVSDDNKTFTTIRTVAASDFTKWATNYETKFVRNYLSASKVYYRLKTVFTNSTAAYTTSISFELQRNKAVAYANVR